MSLPLIVALIVSIVVVLVAIVGTAIDRHAGDDDAAQALRRSQDSHVSGGLR
jgi:hypothetical protein